MTPTARDHMVVSSSQPHADLLPSIEPNARFQACSIAGARHEESNCLDCQGSYVCYACGTSYTCQGV
jgi:hypothetical protein